MIVPEEKPETRKTLKVIYPDIPQHNYLERIQLVTIEKITDRDSTVMEQFISW